MTELTTEVLRTLPPQDLAALLPAPVQIGDLSAVILRVADPDLIEVYFAGRITAYGIKVLEIQPITDPVVREAAWRDAVEALSICRRIAIEAHAEQRMAHATKLDAIRDYAIEAHENGSICRDGLDSFLSAFEFEPYMTTVKVTYTISGSYEVENSSEEAAIKDAELYLVPDLSSLDQVDEYSTSFSLDVDATEAC
ncbi:hypothetical protein EDD96_4537 [Streptomyces sp. Ag109_G2-6]|uniref:hypothetical protein n=1 Tax=Streptomyces TaxID=1883 RepID=UPI0009A5019C|nr:MULTISPECIES: hypothetical protein [Streptomyces]RPF40760.1 hypothetical protein EDD96_4537 [Streptomyces sp. Ag109_G2-6]